MPPPRGGAPRLLLGKGSTPKRRVTAPARRHRFGLGRGEVSATGNRLRVGPAGTGPRRCSHGRADGQTAGPVPEPGDAAGPGRE